jgi:hypothetical protein
MRRLWRRDLAVRRSLSRSGDFFWASVALLAPFGWAFLLCGLEPVRVRVRSRRPELLT